MHLQIPSMQDTFLNLFTVLFKGYRYLQCPYWEMKYIRLF